MISADAIVYLEKCMYIDYLKSRRSSSNGDFNERLTFVKERAHETLSHSNWPAIKLQPQRGGTTLI